MTNSLSLAAPEFVNLSNDYFQCSQQGQIFNPSIRNKYAFIKKSIYLCETLGKMKLHVIWIQKGKTCLDNAISLSSDRSSSDIPGIFLLYPDLLPVKTFMVCQTTVKWLNIFLDNIGVWVSYVGQAVTKVILYRRLASQIKYELTHSGLVTPYRFRNVGQLWFR